MNEQQGSIVCVGVGMTLGSHLSPLSRSYIEQADVVFSLVSDGLVEQWVSQMNPDVRSLQPYYHEGTSRLVSYNAMVAAMISEVKAGKKVVGAFYGHPGVFACVPHKVIEEARALGYYGKMEPGISAEDCLFSDLAIDPGQFGCSHFEASQFMFYKRIIDPSAYLILWQVGIAGDLSLSKFSTGESYRRVLIDILSLHYPRDHQVILYEAPTLPIHSHRIESLSLSALLYAEIHGYTTLVIPPSQELTRNLEVLQRLDAIDSDQKNIKLI
ncbi:SAM-dependent methyltransferase [Thalassomonas haliotis]|uniref:Tetrapyrrole methylase domain-containing protein n=1 Tax=Thalassomonas haliotis TaxID=485448 RepID=A0ABY7V861_9GAMM|nr:SAM-dependent methyltransferase [Thalassomonas haliotis]WDE09812.1 hypothetical protein H3N35_15965 [Thalassomonas haliotis]